MRGLPSRPVEITRPLKMSRSPSDLLDLADLLAVRVHDLQPARPAARRRAGRSHRAPVQRARPAPASRPGGCREHAQDAELAADVLVVDAARGSGASSPARRRTRSGARRGSGSPGLSVARRVDRRHQQRRALELVGRDELELGVEVAPVGRQRRERRIPGARRASLRGTAGFAASSAPTSSSDPQISLLVEPRQQPLDARGRGAGPLRAAMEAQPLPRRPGFSGPSSAAARSALLLVVDRQA